MGKSADDRDPLFTAAASISDGMEIDWKDVGRAAVDDETTAILVQLKVVEQIARVHSEPGGALVRRRRRPWSRWSRGG